MEKILIITNCFECKYSKRLACFHEEWENTEDGYINHYNFTGIPPWCPLRDAR